MNDWQLVTLAEPWRIDSAENAVVRPAELSFRATPQFTSTFPALTHLLTNARRWQVTLPGGPDRSSHRSDNTLFAWGEGEQIRAWLSPTPSIAIPMEAASEHRILLQCFGGITERFNEPDDNWLFNHNDAMTASEADRDASFIAQYAWAFKECGGIPIDLKAFYPVAWEANGNCMLCNRRTGELLLFAPDHAYEDLVPYGPCAELTLYKKHGAGDFRAWVERIATQWLPQTE